MHKGRQRAAARRGPDLHECRCDDDRLRRLGSADFKNSLAQLGYAEGVDYDTFTMQYPYGGTASIGTAGAHGATADQLHGYHSIIYLSGVFTTGTLSAYDVNLLEAWHLRDPGPGGARNVAYFGDGLTTNLINQPGFEKAGDDLRPAFNH